MEVFLTTNGAALLSSGVGHVWLAREGDRLVGAIVLTVDAADQALATSQAMAVVPDKRRHYIGFNLKRAAIEWFEAHGGEFVFSEVDEENLAMRRCNDLFGAASAPSVNESSVLDTVVRIER